MNDTPDAFNAVLASRVDLADGLAVVTVKPNDGPVPAFTPGQYINLGLPKLDPVPAELAPKRKSKRPRLVRRAYSIASGANRRDCYEFVIVRVDDGKLTPRLWDIPLGGQLWMDDQAKGDFSLDGLPENTDLVMIASGTGVAPFISMLRTYGDAPPWRRFTLIMGARYASDLAYREELEAIAQADSRVTYIPIVSREPDDSDWAGLRGRVQVALEPDTFQRLTGTTLSPESTHIFLCGNPAMIDDVRDTMVASGFVTQTPTQPGNLHFERYW